MKTKLSTLALSLRISLKLSAPAAEKTQYFVHLHFNSNFQLINGILSDLQMLLEHFNGTTIVTFIKVPFAPYGALSPNKFPYT